MFRHPARVAVALSLIFFLDSGRSPGADKPHPVAERIADQLATYAVMDRSFGKKVKSFVVGRFSTYDEPLEVKFAHCLLIAYPDIEKHPEQLRLVRAQLSLDAGVLQVLVKDEKYAALLIKSRSLTLAAENKADLRKTFDEWEIRYGKGFNAESAAALLRGAAMMKPIFPKELIEARTKLTAQISRLLADDAELVKTLADALKPTEEVQKSRTRVKELIEEARKK
jgi:hypothetical protein